MEFFSVRVIGFSPVFSLPRLFFCGRHSAATGITLPMLELLLKLHDKN